MSFRYWHRPLLYINLVRYFKVSLFRGFFKFSEIQQRKSIVIHSKVHIKDCFQCPTLKKILIFQKLNPFQCPTFKKVLNFQKLNQCPKFIEISTIELILVSLNSERLIWLCLKWLDLLTVLTCLFFSNYGAPRVRKILVFEQKSTKWGLNSSFMVIQLAKMTHNDKGHFAKNWLKSTFWK